MNRILRVAFCTALLAGTPAVLQAQTLSPAGVPPAEKPVDGKPTEAKPADTKPADAAKPAQGTAAPPYHEQKLSEADETCRASLPKLMSDAERGDALAAYRVGAIYDSGCGVRASQQTAAAYYELAAKHGSIEGAVHLAVIYVQGEALGQDYAKARKLLERPAKIGNPLANFYLGVMEYRGDDKKPPKPDVNAAMEHFKLAADAGFAQAQFIVGQAYFEGKELPRDPKVARAYLSRAASQGHGWAQAMLGRLLAERLVPDADPVEALVWLTLAKANNKEDTLLQSLADAALKRLDGKISPAQALQAQQRVLAFKPKLEWEEKL